MKTLVFAAAILFLLPLTTLATRDFISSGWRLPAGAAMVHFEGEESLFMEKGVALLTDTEMQDGTLEVDIADDNGRGFGGLVFHHNGKGTYEEIYLRLHKSGQPDAVQYTPVFHHSFSWQLYADQQAAVSFQPQSWTHLKVEVKGNSARVFLNHGPEPVLVVQDLKVQNQTSGSIGLMALGGAYFSNFQFTPASPTPATATAAKAPNNAIMRWQVSPAFVDQSAPASLALPPQQITWETISADQTGLLNLAMHRQKQESDSFEGNTNDYVWLKLEVSSDQAQTKQLFFEYSNRAKVFLNGQPLFYGDNSFRAKGALFRGDIDKSLQTNALYLPLRKGKNTLLIAVSSIANGWGIMARWADTNGIQLL